MNPEDQLIGVFIGLASSSYEYLAHIIAPYQQQFAPKVGDFLLIDNGNEQLVSRIMEYVPRGELMTFMGEKWLSEVALYPDAIGQDIKKKKVSYYIKIKLLGRIDKKNKEFTPGISKIPHITSPVMYPGPEITRQICHQALSDQDAGINIGNYALDPNIPIKFDVSQLVGRRTFVFARAGYGKSNLMKVLAANWKKDYGSLMVFDPEGEYSVTDKKGRPGIMDQVPAILVTNRKGVKDELKGVNVYDKLKFNLKEFVPASFIVPIIVNEAKHETIFFSKLMSLGESQWHELVDLLYEKGWSATAGEITDIIQGAGEPDVEEILEKKKEDISFQPIINNLVGPIKKLHDPASQLLKVLEQAAREGLPVIMDISLLDARSALQFASIVVAHFFGQNQYRFTGGGEDLYKIVFVVEEAQSVIGGTSNVGKFVELAKEGRKYQLGGIFITQQPGSIAPEILSQGDNFFVFHMLSKGDLTALSRANAHYSDDILTQVLNEPIRGKSYMWTSNQPFVLPVQISNFEETVKSHQAPTVQEQDRVLDKILGSVAKLEEIHLTIIQKLVEIAAKYNVAIGDDEKFNKTKGLKGEISKTLFRQLDPAQRHFLDQEGAIQIYDGKPFAINYKYLDQLWELVKNNAH